MDEFPDSDPTAELLNTLDKINSVRDKWEERLIKAVQAGETGWHRAAIKLEDGVVKKAETVLHEEE